MKLDGFNMLTPVKAGTQQRSSQSSAKESASESFKDVLGRSDDNKSKSSDNQQPREQQARTREPQPQVRVPARREAQVQKPLAQRLQKPHESKNFSNEPMPVENQAPVSMKEQEEGAGDSESTEQTPLLWDGQKATVKAVESAQAPVQKLESVEAMSLDGEAMPGAPDPSSGMKTSPELAFASPVMMAAVNPMANKTQEVVKDTDVDNLTRRAVWSDFLRRMHEELGVSAEKVLEAFSSLDEKELAAPAEQNVDKLVMALGLNGDQNVLAHKLFTDLIRKTQTKTLGQELASSSKQINLSLMSQRELERRNLQSAIDKMNSAFFMSRQGKLANQPEQNQQIQPAPLAGQEVLGAELADEQSLSPAAALMAPAIATPAPAAAVPTAAPMQAMNMTQSPNSVPQSAKLNKLVEEMEPMTDDEVAEYTQAMNENSGKMFARATKAQLAMANASAASAAAAPAATSAASAGSEGAKITADAFAKALGLSSGAGSKEESREEASTEDSSAGFMVNNQPILDNNIKAPGSEVAFKLPATGVEAAPVPMSVPDMINQARVMVRDGGGEMKVSLTPEGLGEVAMKVSVENGRVNVEMITESDSAKKMIEKGLVDLKSNLHANNLSVDSIKVDTASNLGKQLEQQYQDAQRNQARAFMENFRQNDQGWRRENFMTPSVNIGRSQSQSGASNSTPYPVAKPRSASRRLDLVA